MSNSTDLSNYETSPLRFELELILEEYRSLQAEINTRVSNEQQILYFSITLIVGLVAAIQFLPQLDFFDKMEETLRFGLLFISILFSAFGLLSIEIDSAMALIARYIQKKLKPRIEVILAEARCGLDGKPIILEWENFRAYNQIRSISVYFMAAGRYTLTIVPSFAVLYIYTRWKIEGKIILPTPLENFVYVFSIIALIAVILTAIDNGTKYLNINYISIIKAFVTSKLFVPIITLLTGFVPMLILSLLDHTFWFSNRLDFPFMSIPSVVIGDLVILPIFNYQYYQFIKTKFRLHNLKANLKSIIIIIGISFILSLGINIYSHSSWVNDSYQGFMDTSFGKLSAAGWVHFGFSAIEMTVIVSLVFLSILLFIQKNLNLLKLINKIWGTFFIFSCLSIADFIVRYLYIYKDNDLWNSIIHQGTSFTQLYFAVIVSFLLHLAIKKVDNSSKKSSSQ